MTERDHNTLGDALPREQARCRELLRQYHAIGPAGALIATANPPAAPEEK